MKHIRTHVQSFLLMTLVVVSFSGIIPEPITAEDGLAVYAGTVISNNPAFDSVVMVEFTFSVNRHQFSFFTPDSNDTYLYGRVFAQVDLFDSTGFVVDSVSTYFSLKVASQQEAEMPDYRVFNNLMLMVPPGSYSARVTVIDAVSKKQGEFFLKDIAANFAPADRISVGGVCLAYDLRYVGDDTQGPNPRLLKNGFYVLPNPVSIFTDEDTVVYLYGEVYNLKYAPDSATGYRLEMAALDAQNEVYDSFGSRIAKKPGESAVITESFKIAGYRLGSYSVRIIASDLETELADTVLVPFHIVSPKMVMASIKAEEDLAEYSPDLTVDDHVNMVKAILLPDQLKVLNSLSDAGKLNFLRQYWKEHDIDPTTSVVENRLTQIERYRFCNKVFSSNVSGNDGWMSDRGRVYLKYGPWDKRDENAAPRTSSNAFEVWHYYSRDEGKFFVFEDWSGNNDYRLVHSNVFGEVYSRDWQELIDQGFVDMFD